MIVSPSVHTFHSLSIEIEEFKTVVGSHNAVMLISASKSHEMPLQLDALKKCFTGMMTTNRKQVTAELKKLVDRVKLMGNTEFFISQKCLS